MGQPAFITANPLEFDEAQSNVKAIRIIQVVTLVLCRFCPFLRLYQIAREQSPAPPMIRTARLWASFS
jgi:hypothetical protein